MRNFEYHCPTKLVFGENCIAKLTRFLPQGNPKLMLVFGKGSARTNGVYDQVTEVLAGADYIEFWGIEPNPTVETIRKAIALGKENQVDFVIAVGGGSVIDATKLIVAGLCSNVDAWEIVLSRKAIETCPFGVVLTVPATGSEMNSGAVITRAETKEKYAFTSSHPKFALLDPCVAYTLSKHQIACGLADTFVHVIEQYLAGYEESRVMDRFAEGVMRTVVEISAPLMQRHSDYDLMSNYMISSTVALNGMIAWGTTQDWATHMIGHELTALTGITHGASLVILLPALMRAMKEQKRQKLLQYAKRVWDLSEANEDRCIELAIECTESFFRSLGLATRLDEAGIGPMVEEETIRRIRDRGVAYGEGRNVDADMCKRIFDLCRPAISHSQAE